MTRTSIPRTLTRLERRLSERPASQDSRDAVHAWLFEPAAARRAAEARLAAIGVRVRLRSAYKPLLHAFLEEIDLTGIASIEVSCPVVPGVAPERFVLECHPLDALVGTRSLTFRRARIDRAFDATLPDGDGWPPLRYAVDLVDARGTRRTVPVPIPVRRTGTPSGARALASCGWHGGPLRTDLEEALETALERVGRLPATDREADRAAAPERLRLQLDGPFRDEPLGVDEECVSLAEAMHEELLFGAMETLRTGARNPGGVAGRQVAPLVRAVPDGDWTLDVRVEAAPDEPASRSESANPPDLERADTWLTPDAVTACLEAIGGEAFDRTSRGGRAVSVRHVRATGPAGVAARRLPVVLSAGRHANETTGTVGVLRAALELRAAGTVEFAVAPLLNPDGHALFGECCAAFPRHMHHAGRYSALGADLADSDGDLDVLIEARSRTGATLHVDCHGYPAHEWTRPLTGYLPRGFEAWTIPRGCFLIMRHAPGLRREADRIVDACVAALNRMPELMALNAAQLRRRRIYLPGETMEIRSGVPTFVGEVRGAAFPLCLVSEAPDETVRGERFRLLQEAQRRTVLAAVAAHADGADGGRTRVPA